MLSKHRNKFLSTLLTTLFIVSVFLVPQSIQAAGDVCACYSTDGDCKEVFVKNGSNSEKGCENLCKIESGKSHASSQFGFGTDGQTKYLACNVKHSQWIKANSNSPTTKTSTKAPQKFISPKLNVELPGFSFSKLAISETGQYVESSILADYITAWYQYLISISTIIAIVMVMIGGFQYVLAAGSGDVSKAKTRIKNAVTGLVLLLSVYMILYTVNPQLTLLKSIRVDTIPEVEIPLGDAFDPNAPDLCGRSIQKCKELCATPKESWPKSGSRTIDVALTSRIPNTPGIKNISVGKRGNGTPALKSAIKKAGEIAKSRGSDYLIKVGSAFRPLDFQINSVCGKLKKGLEKDIGPIVAWPGSSPHGSGISLDVMLFKGKTQLTSGFSSKGQKDPKWKEENSKLLDQIMTEAGFVRYGKEMWHYDLAGKSSQYCRCAYPNCKFPPAC